MQTSATTGRLQSLRQHLTIVLVALLPLHAFLVTVATRVIAGPGHAPLVWIALWKELLLALILAIAAVETFIACRREKRLPASDWIDALIVGLFGVAIVSAMALGTPIAKMFLGLRYDLLAPLSFVILRHVPWSTDAVSRMLRTLLIVAVGVAAFALLGLVLPLSIFGSLGYATNFHSLYLPDSPLQPFSQIGDTVIRRAQSTLSGPNQLGIWLVIPIAIVTATSLHHRRPTLQHVAAAILFAAALFLTFSRTAWIGAVAGMLGAVALQMNGQALKRWAAPVLAGLAGLAVIASLLAPQTVIRLSSTRGHFERPLQAITRLVEHPFGEGLASAGPASSRFADACVMLRPQDDPSWAKDQPQLCVFLGDKQVQPTDRLCHCPFHPENWYLQLAVELGWPGLVLWIAIIALVLRRLLPLTLARDVLGSTAAIAQLSLAIGCLFLHAWEDTAVAFTIWILTAVALQKNEKTAKEGSHRL